MLTWHLQEITFELVDFRDPQSNLPTLQESQTRIQILTHQAGDHGEAEPEAWNAAGGGGGWLLP